MSITTSTRQLTAKELMIYESARREVLVDLYAKATEWAMGHSQTTGENRDYFVTLAQLEALMKQFLYP